MHTPRSKPKLQLSCSHVKVTDGALSGAKAEKNNSRRLALASKRRRHPYGIIPSAPRDVTPERGRFARRNDAQTVSRHGCCPVSSRAHTPPSPFLRCAPPFPREVLWLPSPEVGPSLKRPLHILCCKSYAARARTTEDPTLCFPKKRPHCRCTSCRCERTFPQVSSALHTFPRASHVADRRRIVDHDGECLTTPSLVLPRVCFRLARVRLASK